MIEALRRREVAIYLPTDQGNVLVGLIVNDETYAIHTDHLNTPRRMTDAANQPVWSWSYTAFGDNEPTIAARNFKYRSWAYAKKMVKLNLRYPGQYFDDESNLHYNGFPTYGSRTGRYTQGDPIGLGGGEHVCVSEIVRPRTGEQVPICERCQSTFSSTQFPQWNYVQKVVERSL